MLTEVTIKVPQEFGEMCAEVGTSLYVETMKEVIAKRLGSTERRLQELRMKSKNYEQKYHQSYREFSQSLPDSMEAHDDWMDWTYLEELSDKLSQKIQKLSLLVGVS